MKKLIAMLLSCAASEEYADVAKHHLTTYGKWWIWTPANFRE